MRCRAARARRRPSEGRPGPGGRAPGGGEAVGGNPDGLHAGRAASGRPRAGSGTPSAFRAWAIALRLSPRSRMLADAPGQLRGGAVEARAPRGSPRVARARDSQRSTSRSTSRTTICPGRWPVSSRTSRATSVDWRSPSQSSSRAELAQRNCHGAPAAATSKSGPARGEPLERRRPGRPARAAALDDVNHLQAPGGWSADQLVGCGRGRRPPFGSCRLVYANNLRTKGLPEGITTSPRSAAARRRTQANQSGGRMATGSGANWGGLREKTDYLTAFSHRRPCNSHRRPCKHRTRNQGRPRGAQANLKAPSARPPATPRPPNGSVALSGRRRPSPVGSGARRAAGATGACSGPWSCP